MHERNRAVALEILAHLRANYEGIAESVWQAMAKYNRFKAAYPPSAENRSEKHA